MDTPFAGLGVEKRVKFNLIQITYFQIIYLTSQSVRVLGKQTYESSTRTMMDRIQKKNCSS